MNGLPQPAYVMSEPHLSGYRVIIGYETLSDAQAAQAALCRPQAREAAQPPTCQKCGGEIAGWCCQRCPAAFRENDDGALIFNEDAILTALASSSGSGDHAELAEQARRDIEWSCLTTVRPSVLLALIAENAALREKMRTEIKLSVDNYVRATARATEAERALSEHRVTSDLLVSSLKADKAEAERKLAEADKRNDRAADLMRQCTDPDRFEGASTLNVYANMRAWLSDLSKEAERG